MMKTYKSRIGILPALIIFVAFLSFYPFEKIEKNAVLFFALLVSFFLLVYFSINYVLSDKTLTVKALGFKKEISISEIQSVKRTYNPLSSPAFSLVRLEINYGPHNNYVLISPQKERLFIEELSKLNPKILIDL